MNSKLFMCLLTLTLTVAACGVHRDRDGGGTINIGLNQDNIPIIPGTPINPVVPINPIPVEPHPDPITITQTWAQQNSSSPKADILLIIDNSLSMQSEKNELINSLSDFISVLAAQSVDLCVGVSLAAASRFDQMGNLNYLIASNNEPRVLCLQGQTANQLTAQLASRLASIDFVYGGSKNEAPLMALLKASMPEFDRGYYQQHGFFRNDAMFTPFLITDENDISTSPNKPNCSADLMGGIINYIFEPSGPAQRRPNCTEAQVRFQYYSDANGKLIWSYQTIAEKLLTLPNVSRFLPVGIAYLTDEAALSGTVDNIEDERGHGVIELVEYFGGPLVPMELARSTTQFQFNAALSNVGANIAMAANLQTIFTLQYPSCSTPSVYVDGQPVVPVQYTGAPDYKIVLPIDQAGQSGSIVEIKYVKPGTSGCP